MGAPGIEALMCQNMVVVVGQSKSNKYITNSPEIARVLRERDGGRHPGGDPGGDPGRALRGILDQMILDASGCEGQLQLGTMEIGAHADEEAISWEEPNSVEAQF